MSTINGTILQQNVICIPSENINNTQLMKGENSVENNETLTDVLYLNTFIECKTFVLQRIKEVKE
jgi:hypothetical protein